VAEDSVDSRRTVVERFARGSAVAGCQSVYQGQDGIQPDARAAPHRYLSLRACTRDCSVAKGPSWTCERTKLGEVLLEPNDCSRRNMWRGSRVTSDWEMQRAWGFRLMSDRSVPSNHQSHANCHPREPVRCPSSTHSRFGWCMMRPRTSRAKPQRSTGADRGLSKPSRAIARHVTPFIRSRWEKCSMRLRRPVHVRMSTCSDQHERIAVSSLLPRPQRSCICTCALLARRPSCTFQPARLRRCDCERVVQQLVDVRPWLPSRL